MLSPFTVHKAKHLGARTVERVGVDIYVVDVLGEGVEPEAGGQPIRKIVGAELQAKAGGDEVEVEAGVTDGRNAVAKFVERGYLWTTGHGYLQTFAEIKTVEGFLPAEFGKRIDEIAKNAAEIGAECGDGGVIANIERSELFGEGVTISLGEGPLREVVGETLGEKMVGTEGLESVVEDRSVTALLEAGEEFFEISGGLIPDACEIGDGEKFEWGFGDNHCNSSLRPV
jgi:hypothetical protein